MTNKELADYIACTVDQNLLKRSNIDELLFKNVKSTDNANAIMSKVVLQSMRISSQIAVETTLKTLNDLKVINLDSCTLKEIH
ncbi:MAG: hypothetical protein F8N38_01085 [Hungatella sp.]|nr:hypothetical protein [Hungatella sp.]